MTREVLFLYPPAMAESTITSRVGNEWILVGETGRKTMVTALQEAALHETALLNPARELRVSLSEAVETAAEAKLRRSSYPEVGCVRCEFREGILTLWGRVTTYFLKQIAQAVVIGVEGVVGVDNQLEVAPGRSAKWQTRNPK
jgi:osmotically-inducible protein OsmY